MENKGNFDGHHCMIPLRFTEKTGKTKKTKGILAFILGAHCLWHSNWTICSLLSQFGSEIFPTFDFHTRGSVPMAFKLDHLQSVEPIWF